MKKTLQFSKNTAVVFVAPASCADVDITPEDFPAWERRPNHVILRTPILFCTYYVRRVWLKDGVAMFEVLDPLEAEFGNIVLVPAYNYFFEWDYVAYNYESTVWLRKMLQGTGVECGQ